MEINGRGPSDETLSKLAGMLPSMADGIIEGKIHGSDPKGGKICVACTKIFGRPRRDMTKAPGICKECNKTLRGGGTIFVCDDARMFHIKPKSGKSGINPAYAGRVVKVPNSYMDSLYKMLEVDKVSGEGENPGQ